MESGARSAAAQTGASVALPIFEPIIQAVWAQYAPKTPLNPPSAEARQALVTRTIDLASGSALGRGGKGFLEYFRRDSRGDATDTQFALVSRDEVDEAREYRSDQTGSPDYAPFYDGGGRYAAPAPYRDPWSGQSQGYYNSQPAPPRRDVYGQQQYAPPPRRDVYGQPLPPPQQQQQQQRNGFFWDWH